VQKPMALKPKAKAKAGKAAGKAGAGKAAADKAVAGQAGAGKAAGKAVAGKAGACQAGADQEKSAKTVLKNLHSRAYHQALKAAKLAGNGHSQSQALAREAAQSAANLWRSENP